MLGYEIQVRRETAIAMCPLCGDEVAVREGLVIAQRPSGDVVGSPSRSGSTAASGRSWTGAGNPSRPRLHPRPCCVPEQEHELPRLRMSLPSPSMTGPSPMTPRQDELRTVAPRSHGDQRPTIPGVEVTSLDDIIAGHTR